MQRSFGRLCQPIRCASWTEASLLPVSCLRSAKVLPTGTGSHERSAIWPGVSSRNWAMATRSSKWTFEPLPERSIHGSRAHGAYEIKTEMLEREEPLRSKSPSSVTQELWGIFIAYNLVRLEMERVASELHLPPTRISFVTALTRIVDVWSWMAIASPGTIPKQLLDYRERLKRLILPPRRSNRSYPRAVKIKMSNYPRNRRRSEEHTSELQSLRHLVC